MKLIKLINSQFKLNMNKTCYDHFLILTLSISILSLINSSIGWAQSSPFTMQAFSEEVTKASKTNFVATQDKQGQIMLANLRGLLTYNGQKWQLNSFNDAGKSLIKFNQILPQGDTIWVGAFNQLGFLQKKAGQYQFHAIDPGQYAQEKINLINQIVTFQDKVFFLSYNKLFIVQNQQIIQVISTPAQTLFSYLFVVNKRLYLSQYGAGLLVWKDQRFTIQDDTTLFKTGLVYLMESTSQGTLMGFFSKGFWWKRAGKITKVNLPSPIKKIIKKGILYPRMYGTHQVVFGTLQGKVYRLDLKQQTLQEVFQGKGLIKGIHIDQQQNLWILNDNTIFQVEITSPFVTFWRHQDFTDAVADSAGVFAISSQQETIYWLKNSGEAVSLPTPGKITTLCAAKPHHLLIGTNRGLYQVNYITRKSRLILKLKNPLRILPDPFDPNLFYVIDLGSLYIFKLKKDGLTLLKTLKDGNKNIISVLRSPQHIWLGYFSAGVTRFALDQDGLPDTTTRKVYTSKTTDFQGDDSECKIRWYRQQVWVNNPGGIYVYNPKSERFKQIKITRSDSTQDFFTSFAAFQDATILVAGQSNAFSQMGLAQPQGTSALDYQLFSQPFHRLPNYEFRRLLTHQGIFYAATSKGLLKYDPRKTKDYQAPFQTFIQATQNQRWLSKQQNLVLPYRQNNIRFEFSNNFLEAPQKNRYAYQLEGLDPTWSAWSTEYKKEYGNLREGKYTFRVKSQNVYGTEGHIASFSFEILPPWYRTWWAYMLYATSAILLIYGLFRWYTYRIRQRNRQLEQQVQNRTQALHEANEALATTNEQLKALDDLKASFSQMLIHDARQPLTPLINSTDPLIKNAGQRLLNYFDNFLEVQKFEAAEVQLQLSHFELYKLVEEAITQVQFSARQKLIQIQNHVTPQIRVKADQAYLLRVFINLLGNAIKYIPSTGVIVIETTPLPEASDAFLKIWIKDNGPGIADDLKRTIFDKFTRANKGDKRSTGLGLAFCKMAIEAHAGEIGVRTRSEQTALGASGAAFWFNLPQQLNEPNPLQDQAESTKVSTVNQYQFTEKDKQLVKPLLSQLKNLDFCDASDIEAVFDDRTWKGSDALEAWIYALPFLQSQEAYLQQLNDVS